MYPDNHIAHPLAHPANRTEAPTEKPRKPYSYGRILWTAIALYFGSAFVVGTAIVLLYDRTGWLPPFIEGVLK